jgi:hypothetical protein
MGEQSQEGQLGFRTQAAKGTYDDPGAAHGTYPHSGHFMKTRGGSMGGDRELIIPDPEIGGNRDIPDAIQGPIAYSGDFESYMRFNALGTLLTAGLGTVDSTPTGTVFGTDLGGSHVITPTDVAADLPWLSVEEAVAAAWEVFNYTDVRVNTLHLEVDPDGYVMFDAGLIGITATSDETRTAAAVFDTSPLVVGSNVVVSWGGSPITAKSWSWDLDNGIEDDDFALGSISLQDATPKRRSITSGFSIRDSDAATYWKESVWGSAAASAPVAGSSVKRALSVVITAATNNPAGDPYSLTLDFPVASLLPAKVDPSGDDVIENQYDIQIFRPDPAVKAMTATLVNAYGEIL